MAKRTRKPAPEPDEVVDAEIVDEQVDQPGTGLAVRSAPRDIVAHADGDTIYLQMLRDLVGWGTAGTIIQTVQAPYIDAMIANGFAVIVTSPTPTPTPGNPTSIQWQPYTLYPAGWEVFAPNGQFVQRKTTGVSGASFDLTQWTVVNDVGGGVRTVAGFTPDAGGNIDLTPMLNNLTPRSSPQETIAYNGDNTVHTVTETDTGAVSTYAYNGDGTVHTETRVLGGTTTVRTFAYDTSGNLTGVT